jgi:hypothetical protein
MAIEITTAPTPFNKAALNASTGLRCIVMFHTDSPIITNATASSRVPANAYIKVTIRSKIFSIFLLLTETAQFGLYRYLLLIVWFVII